MRVFLFLALITIFISYLFVSCNQHYQPKPKGYNRLIIAEPEYIISPDTLPYQFEYSKHAEFNDDTSSISDKHWVEIYYPELNATIHITYKNIHQSTRRLKELFKDTHTLTAKHQIKAYAIEETILKTPSGKTAFIAEIEGEVPSQFQFTITDSTKHFLRGAIYFYLKVQNDSLKPAIDYVKMDAMHLINTLSWKE